MPDEPTGPGGGVNLGTGGVADEGAESDDSGTDDSSFPGPGEGGGSSGGSGGGGGSDEPSGPGGGVNLGPGLDDPVQDEGAASDDTDRDGGGSGGGGGGGGDGDGEPTGPGGGVDLGPPGPDDTFDDPGGDDEPTGPGGGVNLGPGLDDDVQEEAAASDPQTDRLPPRGEPSGPGGGVNLGTGGVEDEGIDRRPEPGRAVGVGTGEGSILPGTFRDVQRQTDEQIRAEDLRLVGGELRFSREFRREQAAEGTPFDPSDIIIGGSGPRPTVDAQREFQRARRRGMIRGARLRSGGEPTGPGGGVDLGPPGPEGTFGLPEDSAAGRTQMPWPSGTPGGGEPEGPIGPTPSFEDEPIQPTGRVTLAPERQRQPDIPGIGDGQGVTIGGDTGELPPGLGDLFGEGAQAVADDPVQAALGPPGAVESSAGDVAFGIRDVSRGVEEWLNVNVVDPIAGGAGDVAGFVAQGSAIDTEGIDPDDVEEELARSPSPFEQGGGGVPDIRPREEARGQGGEAAEQRTEAFVGGVGRGLTGLTVGLPATAVEAGDVAAGGAEFTASAVGEEGVVPGLETSAVAGGTVVGAAAVDIAEQSAENPFQTAGLIGGGAVGGVATTPVRIASTRVPTAGGGTTAVRGVRLREPMVARPLTGRLRGRTVAGARGFRPSVGAPSIRGVDTDLTRMGGTATATAEPGSAFEADVFRATAADIGDDAAARFRSTEQIQRQAARRPAGAAGFEFDTPEEAIGQARAVPESSVEDVTETLRDIDATVFGSAAARAQLGEFRQPRDIDIVVRDKGEAQTQLGQSLEGETATVSDVFDIKTETEVPSRARGGEEMKFGFESMEPRELGGVRFNPVEEEAIRKAGASAFLREPRAAATPGELDIGPEPRAAGDPDAGIREKDVTDTEMMSRELGFPESDIGSFERAFGLAGAPEEAGGLLGGVPTADDVPAFGGAFARDVRGQAALGTTTTRRGDVAPLARQLEDIGVETRRPRADTESPVGGQRGAESPTPTAGGVSSPSPGAGAGGISSPFGMGGGVDRAGPSPGAGGQDGESPLPGTGQGETPSPGGGPGDDDTPSPFGTPDIPGPRVPPPPSPEPEPEPEGVPNLVPFPQPDPQPDPTPEKTTILGGSRRDSDDQEFSPLLPTGTEFQNPIASGTQFLFGRSDGDSENGDDPAALLGF